MGRIKTTPIKRISKKLFSLHKEEFTADFDNNKKGVVKFVQNTSKSVRNKIAGYLARLVKKSLEGERPRKYVRESRE
ncbi:30S ribosomal protein S17e [Candidatus Woesearchaeota archaeon]|nr:30S ribosomal protein S17e [Candidatus Woesearchaeota archaeon]